MRVGWKELEKTCKVVSTLIIRKILDEDVRNEHPRTSKIRISRRRVENWAEQARFDTDFAGYELAAGQQAGCKPLRRTVGAANRAKPLGPCRPEALIKKNGRSPMAKPLRPGRPLRPHILG